MGDTFLEAELQTVTMPALLERMRKSLVLETN